MTGYPGRPDHPDFWLLSQAVLDLDAQADAGQDAADIIGRYVNPEALIYVARQRALHAMLRRTVTGYGLLSASWIDGFLAGMAVRHLQAQARQDEEGRT